MIDKKLLKLKSKDIKIRFSKKKELDESDLLEIPQFLLDIELKDRVIELEKLEKETGFKRKKILEDKELMRAYQMQESSFTPGKMGSLQYKNPETGEQGRTPWSTPSKLFYLDPAILAAKEKEAEELKERAKRDAEAWKHERQGARNLRLDKQVIDIIYQDMVPYKKRTKRMIIDYFRKNFMNDFKIIKDKYLSGHIGRAVDRLDKLQQIGTEKVGKGKKPKTVYVLGRLAKVTNMSIVQAEQNKKARQQRDQRAIYMKARYDEKKKKKGNK